MAFDVGEFASLSGPDPRGCFKLSWEGETVLVRVDWGSIHHMQMTWGEDFNEHFMRGVNLPEMDLLMFLVSFCVTHEDGSKIELEELKSWQFPIRPMTEALGLAWEYAWRGGPYMGTLEPEGEDPEKKMNPLKASLAWLLRALRLQGSQ